MRAVAWRSVRVGPMPVGRSKGRLVMDPSSAGAPAHPVRARASVYTRRYRAILKVHRRIRLAYLRSASYGRTQATPAPYRRSGASAWHTRSHRTQLHQPTPTAPTVAGSTSQIFLRSLIDFGCGHGQPGEARGGRTLTCQQAPRVASQPVGRGGRFAKTGALPRPHASATRMI